GGGNDTLDFSRSKPPVATVDLSSTALQTINTNLSIILSQANTVEVVLNPPSAAAASPVNQPTARSGELVFAADLRSPDPLDRNLGFVFQWQAEDAASDTDDFLGTNRLQPKAQRRHSRIRDPGAQILAARSP